MNQSIKMVALCMVLLGLLAGCSGDLAEQREICAGQGENIIIGVPVPLEFAEENTKFIKGIDLALENINAEGVNGKKVELVFADDKGDFKTAVDIAQEFSNNTCMLAVIGHWFSDICIPVSNIYEEAGMLTVVPTVSNPDLTAKAYKYVFQSIVNDKEIAKEMCRYAKSNGYTRAVVYYEESSYGENLADALENQAQENGIKIVDRSSGLVTKEQIRRAYDKWRALNFDVVLLALNMPEGADFIRELRDLNQDVGIVSADGLDVDSFIEALGNDAEGVAIATTYSPYNNTPELERFTQEYQDKYDELPDVWAIQGYESLQLIVQAIRKTNSYSPAALADYLHNMEPWQTILGRTSFNEYGEIEGRQIYKKIVVDGQFKYLD